MKLNVGDEIYSVHSFNIFTIEYISKDGNSFVLVSSDGKYEKSRCYTLPDIKRSFMKTTEKQREHHSPDSSIAKTYQGTRRGGSTPTAAA